MTLNPQLGPVEGERVEVFSPAGPKPSLVDGGGSTGLVIRRASEIVAQPVSWLWQDRIALGKVTVIAGEPGLGKSQLSCHIAAKVTTGGTWPRDEGVAPRGDVIVLSAEDDAADTIRPRLDAATADPDRVYIVSAVRNDAGKGHRSFNLQRDLMSLEEQVLRIGNVKLIVIDPISSYLGKVDSHNNADLRAVLEPVGEMASRLGVAVVAITHLNKAGSGSANNRIIGSIALVAAARAAMIVARDPDDRERRLLLPTKNNLGPEGAGLGFRVGLFSTPSGINAAAIYFDNLPVNRTAGEVLDAASGDNWRNARDEAEDFLRDILAEGPKSVKEIEAETKAAGLSLRTVRRAKDRLGIKPTKSGRRLELGIAQSGLDPRWPRWPRLKVGHLGHLAQADRESPRRSTRARRETLPDRSCETPALCRSRARAGAPPL